MVGKKVGKHYLYVKKSFVFNILFRKLAERGRFELPIGLHLCRISSAVHSTTLPPLRRAVRPRPLVWSARRIAWGWGSGKRPRRNSEHPHRKTTHYPLTPQPVAIIAGLSINPHPCAAARPRNHQGDDPLMSGSAPRPCAPVANKSGAKPRFQLTPPTPSGRETRLARGSRAFLLRARKGVSGSTTAKKPSGAGNCG